MKLHRKTPKGILYGLAAALLCCVLSAQAASAQSNRVVLSKTSMTTKEVIGQIEAQTGCIIAYAISVRLNESRTVSFAKTDNTVDETLAALLAGTGLTYQKDDKYIVIKPAAAPATRPAPVTIPPVDNNSPERIQGVVLPPLGERVVLPPVPEPVRPPAGNYPHVRNLNAQPRLAVKTNVLALATASINLGVEVRTGRQTTIDVPVGYNAWDFPGNRKWRHFTVQPEFRLWLCEAFNGHFFGVHALYAEYNVNNLPKPFSDAMRQYRYDGWLAGAGVSYGYHWIVGKHWGIEATVGAGWAYLEYDKYPCQGCGRSMGLETKNYFGPTKAGISLIYMIK